MPVAACRATSIKRWTGILLAIAGVGLLIGAASGIYSEAPSGFPFSGVLTPIPFGIGVVLIPLVLFWSYQYLADRTPTSAIVGVAFVAMLPVGSLALFAWVLLSRFSDVIPELAVLPVRISVVASVLLVPFAVGVATFGITLLRHERTRLLGGSLVTFASAWAIPLAMVALSSGYPIWLSDLHLGSVAATMIAIGYCFTTSDVTVDTDSPVL